MNIKYLEEEMYIEREKLNQIIIENNLDMSCEAVLHQSKIVDGIVSKLMRIKAS